MTQLDVPTAAARLAELVAAVRAGEEVVIADAAGRPVARLMAVTAGTSAAGPVPSANTINAPFEAGESRRSGSGLQTLDYKSPPEPPPRPQFGLFDTLMTIAAVGCGCVGAAGVAHHLSNFDTRHMADLAGCAALALVGFGLAGWLTFGWFLFGRRTRAADE